MQAAEQAQQARLEQVGRERLGQQQLGTQTLLQEREQGFRGEQLGFDRTLQRDLAESAQENSVRLTQMDIDARENLTKLQGEINTDLANLNNDARTALEELTQEGDLKSIKAQGEISQAITQMDNEARMALQNVIGEQAMSQLLKRGELDKEIFELDSARRINEIELNFENQLEELGVRQAHDMDKFDQQLKAEYERMDRQLGGGGGFLGFLQTPTAAELAAEAQERGFDYRDRQLFLNDQIQTADLALRREELDLQRRNITDRRQIEIETLAARERIAALENLAKSQFSFGNTQRGIINDLISNPDVLEAYGAGNLNPTTTSYLETAITTFATPVTSYNPLTGQLEETKPKLPRGLQDALYQRIQAGLPMPFGNTNFAKGGEVQKMQMGGVPRNDPTAVLEAFGLGPQQQPIREEDIQLPGRIVEPGVDLTQGTGLLRGPREAIRAASSYAKELTGSDFEPVFGETAEAATQLTTLGNVTQRFIP